MGVALREGNASDVPSLGVPPQSAVALGFLPRRIARFGNNSGRRAPSDPRPTQVSNHVGGFQLRCDVVDWTEQVIAVGRDLDEPPLRPKGRALVIKPVDH